MAARPVNLYLVGDWRVALLIPALVAAAIFFALALGYALADWWRDDGEPRKPALTYTDCWRRARPGARRGGR